MYGAFASLLEGGRLMVFFANSYIKAKEQERQAREDARIAFLLTELQEDLSFEEAMEKVKKLRRREEVGLARPTSV